MAGATPDRISTGVTGIDTVLDGGLISDRSVLVRGPPGAGKTLFGLHYLTAGVSNGEDTLFINMGEPERYVREDAVSFGFDTDAIHFLDLTPDEQDFHAEEAYDVFATAEVEGPLLAETIAETVEEVQPDRIFIDPMTQLRYLVDDPYQFRKQVMAFLRFLEDTSLVFTSQSTRAVPDDDLQFLSDAVIDLDRNDERRTLSVSKFRGSDYRSGAHSLRITDDGIVVSPRLVPAGRDEAFAIEPLSVGVPELDSALRGGFERGTVALLSGPTGVGKTTIGLQFMREAAGRGTRSVLYSFEESRRTLLDRAEAVDIPISEMLEQGTLRIAEIDPGESSVDEFAQRVRRDVEDDDTEIVMIDAIDGYRRSLLGVDGTEDITTLCRYLRSRGVTTLIANEVHHVTGDFQVTEEGISQIADTIVFLRYIEYQGELRKVIGVLKKRTSDFERTLRELRITEHGLRVGDPLPDLRGILTGTPEREWDRDDSTLTKTTSDATDT